jgi:hypothetical protein
LPVQTFVPNPPLDLELSGTKFTDYEAFQIPYKVLYARRHKSTVQGARLKAKGKNALNDD